MGHDMEIALHYSVLIAEDLVQSQSALRTLHWDQEYQGSNLIEMAKQCPVKCENTKCSRSHHLLAKLRMEATKTFWITRVAAQASRRRPTSTLRPSRCRCRHTRP